MEYLPRGSPATRDDLDALGQRLDQRIDGLDQRIDGLDQRIDGLDQRMHGLHEDFVRLDERLAGHGHRFDALSERIDLQTQSMAHLVVGTIHEQIGGVRADMVAQTRLLFFTMIGTLMTLSALAFGAARLS